MLYGPDGETAVNVSVSGTNHQTYTAVGLTSSTNYSIEVAAVNTDGGVGPFSPPIFVRTPDLASEWEVTMSINVVLHHRCRLWKEKVYHAACVRMHISFLNKINCCVDI